MHLTANFLGNLPLKKNCKSVKILQNYGHESVVLFLAHPACVCKSCDISQVFFSPANEFPALVSSLHTIPFIFYSIAEKEVCII